MTNRLHVPPPLASAVSAALAEWAAQDGTARLWRRDARLWTGGDEARWLGWLDAVPHQQAALHHVTDLRYFASRDGFRDILLLGMGGSSLCPLVLADAFGPQVGWPRLRVLDSTDPGHVTATFEALDPRRTLVVVASKSGTTLEPAILRDAALAWLRAGVGDRACRHCLAITDPGSRLEQEAVRDGFRAVVHGIASIGGRYSALSPFGLVPAALAGLDVELLLARAAAMRELCMPGVPAEASPGILAGVLMAAAARTGRDKLTILASPRVAGLGLWLEQLVAESTGKQGKGIVPVAGERPGPAAVYGDDRLFVHLRLGGETPASQDAAVSALEAAGQPVVHLALRDRYDLGAQFFLWEIATAVAGALLGVHPFDQPDVEAAKLETRRLMEAHERGAAAGLQGTPRLGPAFDAQLRTLLQGAGPGDYFTVLAYLPPTPAVAEPLERIRHRVRDERRVAAALGFGPRYLHSTGQLHKGGPPTGVFLLVTAEAARDVPVPGRPYGFAAVEAAQARGDLAVLSERGRRVLHVHLDGELAAGLAALETSVERVLRG